jgi:hypothetical protein
VRRENQGQQRSRSLVPAPNRSVFLATTPIEGCIGHRSQFLYGLFRTADSGSYGIYDETASLSRSHTETGKLPGRFASNPPWLALMWLQFMSHRLYMAPVGQDPVEGLTCCQAVFLHASVPAAEVPAMLDRVDKRGTIVSSYSLPVQSQIRVLQTESVPPC